jgi:hypothetical protein
LPRQAGLGSRIARPSSQDDPTLPVTRFNPATTRPPGHTAKVDGSMSAKAGSLENTLYLTASHVFAYAVGPASGEANADIRAIVQRSLRMEVVNPAYFETMDGKAWIDDYAASSANIQCYEYDGYVDPDFLDDGAPPDTAGTVDPYPSGNLLTTSASPNPTSSVGACQAASRD